MTPRDSYGNTPLWTAAINACGNGELIALLLRAGADPHAQNAYGNSPVSLARTAANANLRRFLGDLPTESPG